MYFLIIKDLGIDTQTFYVYDDNCSDSGAKFYLRNILIKTPIFKLLLGLQSFLYQDVLMATRYWQKCSVISEFHDLDINVQKFENSCSKNALYKSYSY